MDSNKSQDSRYKPIIAALLRDVQTSHSDVFTRKALRLTTSKVEKRIDLEGIGFLTKTLPRIGKALDRALSSNTALSVPFERKLSGTQLPRFLGELFSNVFDSYGMVLPKPCVTSIKSLRQVLFCFYKLKLPYNHDQEQDVINGFISADNELVEINAKLASVKEAISNPLDRIGGPIGVRQTRLIRRARALLSRVLSSFDATNIIPRHGPGAVSTQEQFHRKYLWSNIPDRITQHFPIDSYFYVSLDHVVDSVQEINSLGSCESPARVLLVQKDSRGPRLISCEPLVNQWIQQGISRALVRHVERHRLTSCRVNFTDQTCNRVAALYGSRNGRYVTLDLKEASDRISLGLVRLLFPDDFVKVLESVRSMATKLPNGRIIMLNKHAPMGSALCFPILALAVWAILNAVAPDADSRERILVYGDDVIVPRTLSCDAIEQLEYYGLLVNRDKSCLDGFFRESCGMDAYLGIDVTPTRLRVPQAHHPSPDHYEAWISYANSFYRNGWFNTYDVIVAELVRLYGPIPHVCMNIDSCPCLVEPSAYSHRIQRRVNSSLQKVEYRVRCITSKKIRKSMNGWSLLLRFLSERDGGSVPIIDKALLDEAKQMQRVDTFRLPFDIYQKGVDTTVSEYTRRHANIFAWRWL